MRILTQYIHLHLRAHSIYLIETNKKFTKVLNTDRIKFDYRIRDLKYVDSLDGHILIFENIPSIGFIKIRIKIFYENINSNSLF